MAMQLIEIALRITQRGGNSGINAGLLQTRSSSTSPGPSIPYVEENLLNFAQRRVANHGRYATPPLGCIEPIHASPHRSLRTPRVGKGGP